MATNTYPQFLTRGLSTNLNSTTIEDGKIRFTTDEGKLYIDYGTGANAKRFAISDVVTGLTEAQIRALASPEDKLYLASDSKNILVYVNSAWDSVTTKTPVMTYAEYNALPSSKLTDGVLRLITDMPTSDIDNSIIAASYNTTTSYAVGDYCIYDNVLQRCIGATSGTWDSTKWQSTTVGGELKSVTSRLSTAESDIDTLETGLASAVSDISDLNTIYTVVFDADDWTSSAVSSDYPYEQTVTLTGLDTTGAYQAIVIPGDGTAFLSDEEQKIYTNMVYNNNQLTAYASEEPADDITVQISKRM